MLNASRNLSSLGKIQKLLIFGWFLTVTLVACDDTQSTKIVDIVPTVKAPTSLMVSTTNSATSAVATLSATGGRPSPEPTTGPQKPDSSTTISSTITEEVVPTTQCSYATPIAVQTAPTSGPDNGIPAINPQNKSTDPSIPSFGLNEVIQYIKSRRALGKLVFDTPATVDKVEFLTSKNLNVRLCRYLGLNVPDDSLLSYVELSGNFETSLPPNPTNPNGTVIKTNHALVVFDAHSGNLLLVG